MDRSYLVRLENGAKTLLVERALRALRRTKFARKRARELLAEL